MKKSRNHTFLNTNTYTHGGGGYAVAHCATSRRVAGSIPGGVFQTFLWLNFSSRTMTLRSDSTTKRIGEQKFSLGVKAAGALGWQTCQLQLPTYKDSGNLKLMETSENVQFCKGTSIYTHTHTHTERTFYSVPEHYSCIAHPLTPAAWYISCTYVVSILIAFLSRHTLKMVKQWPKHVV